MKTLKIILLSLILIIGININTDGAIRHQKNKPVGAPIDGGLLTILGAAGVSYYLIRKKKNDTTI